jgi:hypothetical protein
MPNQFSIQLSKYGDDGHWDAPIAIRSKYLYGENTRTTPSSAVIELDAPDILISE